MIDPPSLARSAGHDTAIIHLNVPREAMRTTMGPAHAELMAAVEAQGIPKAGWWFTHHLRIDSQVFDFEIGVQVARPVAPAGRVAASQFPVGTVARTVYHGPYEGLRGAWSAFDAWLQAEGHAAATDLWECYLKGPESGPDSSTWSTELRRTLLD